MGKALNGREMGKDAYREREQAKSPENWRF